MKRPCEKLSDILHQGVRGLWLMSFLSLHACVCVHIHVCVQLNAIAQVWRSKGNLWCLQFSPSTFSETWFLLFATHARPAGPQASGDGLSCLYPLSHSRGAKVTDVCRCVQLWVGSRDLKSCPHASMGSLLPTDTSPQAAS